MGKINNPTGGSVGTPGLRGTKRFQDNGIPGNVSGALPGDEYLNLENGDLYLLGSDGTTWGFSINLRGPKGADSVVPGPPSTTPGPAGPRGFLRYSGAGAPGVIAGVRADDEYLNTTNHDLYKYVNGAWSVISNIRGAPGVVTNPLIVTGLTGGTNGNVTLRTPGTSTLVDAHPSMKAELSRGALYWKASDGTVYAPGAVVTAGNNDLTPGSIVALTGKISATGRNWTTFPTEVPVALEPTSTQSYVEIGSTETASLLRFHPRPVIGESDNLALFTENAWAGYTTNTPGVLATIFEDIWTPSTSIRVIADAVYVNGRALHQPQGNTSARRHMAYKPHGQFRDGQILAVGLMKFAGTKILQVGMRASGGVGTETAIICQIDGGSNTFKIIAFANGVATTLFGVGISAVGENVQYAMQLSTLGTRIRGRAWVRGQAVPDYSEVYSDLVMSDGYAGMSGRTGDSYFPSVGIAKGYGDVPLTIL